MATVAGIERTLRTLLRSRNGSATAVLVAALDATGDELRTGAVRALALREDSTGHRRLVERLQRLPEAVRHALADVPQSAPLARTLPALITSGNNPLARRAAEAAAIWRLPEALAAIVAASREADADVESRLATVARMLARELEQRLSFGARPDDGCQDPSFARRAAINELVALLNDYGRRGSRSWLEVLLTLAPGDEPAVLRVLMDEAHAAHQPLVEALGAGREAGVARLLGHALSDTRSPQALLDIAAARNEPEVIAAMLAEVSAPIGLRVRENCGRIDDLAWLEADRIGLLTDMPGDAQAKAIAIAAASKASRRRLVAAIGQLLRSGAPEAKAAAAKAIERVPSHLASEPLAMALDSDEPAAAATAAKLLRKKNLPQATGQLVGLLDHDDERVRRSAQRSLKEVSLATFRDHYETLDPKQRESAGRLVGKADPLAIESLRAELRSGAAGRRLKALELIEATGLAASLTAELLAAAEDRDAGVRCEAIRLLGGAEPTEAVRQAIRVAAVDRSAVVRDAAAAVADRLGEPALLVAGDDW